MIAGHSMIKGFYSIEEQMFAVIILLVFMMLIIPIFLSVLSNIKVNIAYENLGDIHAIEFANLVKHRLQGDSNEKAYSRLESMQNLDELGLINRYATVDDIINHDKFVFFGPRAKSVHETYIGLGSDHYPVTDDSQDIMKSGQVYILHIYRVKGGEGADNVIVDVYDEPFCRPEPEHEGFRILSCSQLLSLLGNERISLDSTRLEGLIGSVNSGNIVMEKVMATANIKPANIELSGLAFAGTKNCIGTSGKICYRLIGSYSFPGKLQVEINLEDDFNSGR